MLAISALWAGVLGCESEVAGPGIAPPPESPFPARETAESVKDAITPPDGSAGLRTQLRLAGETLASEGSALFLPGSPDAAGDRVLSAAPVLLAPLARRAVDGADGGRAFYLDVLGLEIAETVFPPAVLGKTFVWDPEAGGYAVDPARTGAPPDGVRFLLYEADPETGEPASAQAVGHLDLSDESEGATTRIRARAVDTTGASDLVLLDYLAEGSTGEEGADLVVSLRADGFVSDGARRMEFSFAEELAIAPGFERVRFSIDDRLSVPSEDVSVRVAIEGEGTEESNAAVLSLTIEDGSEVIVLSVEALDDQQDGTLTYNDETVVLVSGTPEQPIFTDAEGGALSQADVEALREIYAAVERVFELAGELLGPVSALFSFELF